VHDHYQNKDFDFNCAKKYLHEAVINYDLAIESNPSNLTGLIGKARTLRRMAELAGYQEDIVLKNKYWDQAISILNQIIKNNPESSRALYNRACYLIALGRKDEAKPDLEKAIRIQPGLKAYVKNDKDFDTVRSEPGFKEIIE
jgi:tetratricopeptide (TPR) repeat protein